MTTTTARTSHVPSHDPGQALIGSERRGLIGPRSCGSWSARVALIAAGSFVAVALAGGLAGCGEALIDDNQERSQYDRYDALRDQRPPAALEDEFGNRKPNLRGRLLRRD